MIFERSLNALQFSFDEG